MTMQPPSHVAAERLAALAGDDPDLLGDVAARLHIAACERCAVVVHELRLMRTALSELPDLTPPRPLRLLPAAAVPVRGGIGGALRRAFAPALVAGAALVLVGAIGVTDLPGRFLGGTASSAAAPVTGDRLAAPSAAAIPAPADGAFLGSPTPELRGMVGVNPSEPSTPGAAEPWFAVLLIGVAIMLSAAAARWLVQPRAG